MGATVRGDFDEDEFEDYELRPGVDYGDTVVEAGSVEGGSGLSTWIDRFAMMSPEARAMTVAEDPSTLTALVNEAALVQDWYRRWCLARRSDPPTQPEPIAIPNIAIGDVVLVGGHAEPPQFKIVTTVYESEHWQARLEEIAAVFRPVWRNGQLAEGAGVPDGLYLCACTCGCVDRTIRRGRCMVCRVRESCLKERICEACEDGYRLALDGIHYDHNGSTWGVCRKVVSSIKFGAGLKSWP